MDKFSSIKTLIFGLFVGLLSFILVEYGVKSFKNHSFPSIGALFKRPVLELKTEDIIVGTGEIAESGKIVTVHYNTFLAENMKKIDSSIDRGVVFKFKVGSNQVIQGWDLGVRGMKVGGKRRITVPSKLAYGEKGAGFIVPPNSVLIYETQLIAVQEQPPVAVIQNQNKNESKTR